MAVAGSAIPFFVFCFCFSFWLLFCIGYIGVNCHERGVSAVSAVGKYIY